MVRAGLPKVRQGEPFLPGPVFAAPFHFSGEPEDSAFVYGRYGNPTWERYEHALGSLERAEAVLFPSGMAAVAALLLTALRPGSVLAVDSSCYLNVRRFAAAYLEDNEVEVQARPGRPSSPARSMARRCSGSRAPRIPSSRSTTSRPWRRRRSGRAR